MGQVRVYVNPFNPDGSYKGYTDYTRYVVSKDFKVKRRVDNDDYNVGVFKYSSIPIVFNNDLGIFSDVDNVRSIFSYKRAGSKVKITWEQSTKNVDCGVAVTDDCYISEEITVFEGLLSDKGSKTTIRQQNIDFQILGLEAVFTTVEVPFSSISNSDYASDIIYACLNQDEITELFTVDSGNISLSIDPAIDNVEDFENQTVKEALDTLLEMSNSILYIRDDTVYVVSREPSADVKHTFHGQGSLDGTEDIIKIDAIRQGLNKVFNYWTWDDTTLISSDETSVDLYGVSKKEIGYSGITNNTTRQNILVDSKDEFRNPKKEMVLHTPLSYDTYDLDILDRVNVNYPTIYFSADGNPLPIYGVSKFGEAVFPYGEWSLTLDESTNFKILGKDISVSKQSISFYLREI